MSTETKPSTAVATIEPPATPYALRSPIADVLRSPEALAVIAPLIPKGVDFEEVLIEVYRAYTATPEIARCTAPSIALAVGTAVQLGLQIGRTVHLVPVRKKVSKANEPERYELQLNAWTDFKGDIELVVRSGAARLVEAHAVYEGDPLFDYELGDSPFVRHRPQLDSAKRGKLIAAYSVAHVGGGTLKKIAVMSIADIEKVRKGSKQWNPDKVAVCPEWYAVKTVIHRNCKALPKNERLARVLALFEHQEAADRGDEALDEVPLELDPSREVRPLSSVDAEPSSQGLGQPTATPPSAGDDVATRESQEVQPPARPVHELWPMPFGGEYVGKPIGDVSTPDLEKLLQWAMRNGKQAEFVERASQILDDRRWSSEADAAAGASAE